MGLLYFKAALQCFSNYKIKWQPPAWLHVRLSNFVRRQHKRKVSATSRQTFRRGISESLSDWIFRANPPLRRRRRRVTTRREILPVLEILEIFGSEKVEMQVCEQKLSIWCCGAEQAELGEWKPSLRCQSLTQEPLSKALARYSYGDEKIHAVVFMVASRWCVWVTVLHTYSKVCPIGVSVCVCVGDLSGIHPA